MKIIHKTQRTWSTFMDTQNNDDKTILKIKLHKKKTKAGDDGSAPRSQQGHLKQVRADAAPPVTHTSLCVCNFFFLDDAELHPINFAPNAVDFCLPHVASCILHCPAPPCRSQSLSILLILCPCSPHPA